MKNHIAILAALLAFVGCNSVDIYVSPDGNDASIGTKNAPLATVEAAVQRAAEHSRKHRKDDIEIIFADGVYPVCRTIAINGDMFAGALTLKADDGAHPVFSAEKALGGWQKVSDERALSLLSCPEKVLQADLKAAGVTDFGEPVGDKNRFDLYYKGKRQTLAMWPNEGFTYAGKALGKTPYYNYLGESFTEPVLQYADSHIDNWTVESAPCLHGYWGYDWFDMYNPVEIDKAAKKLTIGGSISTYGYRTGCRFRGVNLLSEIDMPGEYWVDRGKGLIFWYAPEGFDGEGVTVSDFSEDYMFELDGCRNCSFIGIEMCGSRGGAISVSGGSGFLVADCSFKRFAQDVIVMDGGYGHMVRGCLLTELGCAGLIIKGGDRDTLEPADFDVCDCTIETLSLYRKTYQPCIRFGGAGIHIHHNLFRDCPSSALRLDGNDIDVEYNIFENLVTESDDQGGIDIFNNYTFRGITIYKNYFHNIGDPEDNIAGGVRFDDRISGAKVISNIFNHCGSSGFGGVQIHGGQDNMVRGNVFYDCTFAVSHSPWDFENWLSKSENERALLGLTPQMDALTALGELYLQRYPDIAHMLDESLMNRNYVMGNLIVNTPAVLSREGFNIVAEDNTFIPEDTAHGLEYWISDKLVDSYGLEPLEFGEMGPRKK